MDSYLFSIITKRVSCALRKCIECIERALISEASSVNLHSGFPTFHLSLQKICCQNVRYLKTSSIKDKHVTLYITWIICPDIGELWHPGFVKHYFTFNVILIYGDNSVFPIIQDILGTFFCFLWWVVYSFFSRSHYDFRHFRLGRMGIPTFRWVWSFSCKLPDDCREARETFSCERHFFFQQEVIHK